MLVLVLLASFTIIIVILFSARMIHKYENSNGITPDSLFKHLNFLSKTLTKHKIKHWVIYGTLLGAVRDGDIISYDYDFDLGANLSDVDQLLGLNKEIKKMDTH